MYNEEHARAAPDQPPLLQTFNAPNFRPLSTPATLDRSDSRTANGTSSSVSIYCVAALIVILRRSACGRADKD